MIIKKFIFFIFIFVLILHSVKHFSQDKKTDIDIKLSQIAINLEQNLTRTSPVLQRLKLFIHSFTFERDSIEMTSDFCDYLIEKMENLLKESRVFEILPRKKVKETVKTRDWQIEKVTPTIPENIGAIAGAQTILIGKFVDFGNKIKVSAVVRDVRTREIISDASVLINKKSMPSDVSIYSENYDKVSFGDLADTLQYSMDEINLDVFVNHAADGQYRVGEEMKIFIKTDKSCYIRILYRDTKGDDVILFPAHPSDNDYIEANKLYQIPPDNSYRIVAIEPYGTECLKVFASTSPFNSLNSVDISTIRERGMTRINQNIEQSYGEKAIPIRVTK